jgi:hypothetical protein
MEITFNNLESAKIGLAGLKTYVMSMHPGWTAEWDDESKTSFASWDGRGEKAQKGYVEMVVGL